MAPAMDVACGGPLIPKEIDIQLHNKLDLSKKLRQGCA